MVCGIEGKYFAKEKFADQSTYHLNLYAVDNNGDEILITKDHIMPHSKVVLMILVTIKQCVRFVMKQKATN